MPTKKRQASASNADDCGPPSTKRLKTKAKSRSETQDNTNDSKKSKASSRNADSADNAPATLSVGQLFKYKPTDDSSDTARRVFDWILGPDMSVEQFYEQHWEKKPLLVKRNDSQYFKDLLSMEDIWAMITKKKLKYGEHLDVTSYTKSEGRKTHNKDGFVSIEDVKRAFGKGCSIRLQRPQEHAGPLWRLASWLEEAWDCPSGVNTYLTPAGTQGFSPHHDPVDVFMMQTEGAKSWKIYAPLSEAESLPRFSSRNFEQSEVGKPYLEFDLEAGDLLYLPRGWIHQGQSSQDVHSLHVTISCGWKHTMADLVAFALDGCLQTEKDNQILPKSLRASAPHGSILGVTQGKVARASIANSAATAVGQIEWSKMPWEHAVKALAVRSLGLRLPPHLPPASKKHTCGHGGPREVGPEDRIRLVRRGVLLTVREPTVLGAYHCCQNDRSAPQGDTRCLDFEPDMQHVFDLLASKYPKYVKVSDLPLDDEEEKLEVANALYDETVIMVRDIPEKVEMD